jgi:RNase H-fold protein (predicted Holliday junction resolvase)
MFDIKKKILELDGKQARNTSELTHEQILKIILENERLSKALKAIKEVMKEETDSGAACMIIELMLDNEGL